MVTIHAGATLERPPGTKYQAALHFAELSLPAPLPRAATLGRWRADLGEDVEVALVAPRPTMVSPQGPLHLDDDLGEAVAWLLDAADALAARALVFATGPEITTGRRDRDRLARYFEQIPREPGRLLVWAPGGLWEPELAIPQAEALGVLYGFDPLESPPPPGPVAYGRLRAAGGRQRYGEGVLLDVLDRLVSAAVPEAYVAIESPRSFREASNLQRLADEMTALAAEDEDEDEDEDEVGEDDDPGGEAS
ncbi:MAG: hypothetical protein ACOC9O_03805 [Myxococcota bacterium]